MSERIARLAVCGVLAARLLCGVSGADQEKADEKPPEAGADKAEADRVLRGKGLRKYGPAYVLDAEDDVRALAAQLAVVAEEAQGYLAQLAGWDQSVADLRATINSLTQQQQLLLLAPTTVPTSKPAGSNPGQSGNDPQGSQQQADQARLREQQAAVMRAQLIANLNAQIGTAMGQLMQAQNMYNRVLMMFNASRGALRRGQVDLETAADKVRKRYDDLANDTEVKAALGALNKGAGRVYALGPLEDYKANARRFALGVLEKKGFEVKRGGTIVLGADEDLKAARSLVKSIQFDLAVAKARLNALLRDSAFKAKRTADLAARGTDANTAELAKMRQEEADREKVIKAVAQDLATKRQGFVEAVDVLRKAYDASRKKGEDLVADRDVPAMIKAVKGKVGRLPVRHDTNTPPELRDAEKYLQVVEVPVVADRAAQWVTATVNDHPGRKFVLDPTADSVRVSSGFADAMKISAAGGEASVATADGEAVRARRGTIKTLNLGGLAVADVPCLILLDGSEAPPVLGASFLDRFVTRIDAETNQLTIIQETVPPHAGRTPAPAKRGR